LKSCIRSSSGRLLTIRKKVRHFVAAKSSLQSPLEAE
jgi:hypothetical protein